MKEVMNTVDVKSIVEMLVEQYGYTLTEENEDGFIMENVSLIQLGNHSLLFHCDYEIGEVTQLIGQVDGEPDRENKHSKIQELIQNVASQLSNPSIN